MNTASNNVARGRGRFGAMAGGVAVAAVAFGAAIGTAQAKDVTSVGITSARSVIPASC